MEKQKFTKLTGLILKDKGKTSIFKLAEVAGLTQEEIEKDLSYEFYRVAQYTKKKALEVSVTNIDRKDMKSTLATSLFKVSEKMLTLMNDKDFDISEGFSKKIGTFLSLFQEYTKLEGMNKPDKLIIEHQNNIDTSNLESTEAEALMLLLDKCRVKRED